MKNTQYVPVLAHNTDLKQDVNRRLLLTMHANILTVLDEASSRDTNTDPKQDLNRRLLLTIHAVF